MDGTLLASLAGIGLAAALAGRGDAGRAAGGPTEFAIVHGRPYSHLGDRTEHWGYRLAFLDSPREVGSRGRRGRPSGGVQWLPAGSTRADAEAAMRAHAAGLQEHGLAQTSIRERRHGGVTGGQVTTDDFIPGRHRDYIMGLDGPGRLNVGGSEFIVNEEAPERIHIGNGGGWVEPLLPPANNRTIQYRKTGSGWKVVVREGGCNGRIVASGGGGTRGDAFSEAMTGAGANVRAKGGGTPRFLGGVIATAAGVAMPKPDWKRRERPGYNRRHAGGATGFHCPQHCTRGAGGCVCRCGGTCHGRGHCSGH